MRKRRARSRRAPQVTGRRRRRDFAGRLRAHDIRTALTGILALERIAGELRPSASANGAGPGIKAAPSTLPRSTTLMIDAAKAGGGALALRDEVFSPRR